MICLPYTLSRPDRYCRLLPPFQHSGDPKDVECRLKRLALSMFPPERHPTDPMAAVGDETAGGVAGAAYTYFGQFIMHDLTFDDTPFREAGLREPEETINYRTPRLDLDSVYGDGPSSVNHGHLYDGISFNIGTDTSNQNEVPFDVPFIKGMPAIVDERNLENAILRQVHAMLLKLHNLAVRNLSACISDKTKLFEAARARVRWQFQKLVRHDFLPKVCDAQVYRAVVKESNRLIYWPPGHFSIPVEFSQAAARFGHSMVRESYELRRDTEPVDLVDLFGSQQRGAPLGPGMAIQWSHFAESELARDIDTRLENPFRRLPDGTIHSYVASPFPHEPHMLAVRTLCRGAATQLPTGQQVRVALQPHATLRNPEANSSWKNLQELGFESETPLWYYVMLEAETNGNRERLGPIGSRLVAEVIEAALLHDPSSFLFEGGGAWVPLWKSEDGNERLIESLTDFAVVIGLEPEGRRP